MKGQEQGQGQLGDATISQEELITIDNVLVKAREFLSLSPQLGPGLTQLKQDIVTADQLFRLAHVRRIRILMSPTKRKHERI
jgi:hypothetical protein